MPLGTYTDADIPAMRARVAHRPWAAKTLELEPVHHHWADYGAWEWWMAEVADRMTTLDAAPILDSLDCDAKVNLYCAMCACCDGYAKTGMEGDQPPSP